jgi:Na+/H+ antiporter NhaD/arsenite permease-like protein
MISLIVLGIVFILISIRQIGSVKLDIWQIMLGGALVVLVTGQISILNAAKSINLDVILFLFGMFIVGQALEQSGYLSYIAYNFFKKAKTINSLIVFILLGGGIAAAFLMNDTIAIIGTPVVLLLGQKHKIPSKVLLLTLAFAVTIGSTMSPIGNPQNLLIAIHETTGNPFIVFLKLLVIPTIINLFVVFIFIKIFFKEHIDDEEIVHQEEKIVNPKLAKLCKLSILLILILIATKIIFVYLDVKFDFKLTYIALIAALPVILFGNNRIKIIKNIDWHTLVFFAAMFILMQSVWDTGYFQKLISGFPLGVTSIIFILIVSVLLSQLISNVPLVALYLPLLLSSNVLDKGLMALAAGSTIAGNMLILGAASNIIIIQNAEKRNGGTLSFWEFARIGVPLTIVNIAVYYFYFKIF